MFGMFNVARDANNPDQQAGLMTPDSIRERRALARALLQRGSDTSPVQHWSQGAARLVDALSGSLDEYTATRAEQAGLTSAREAEKGLFSMLGAGGAGIAPSGPASAPEATGASASPSPSFEGVKPAAGFRADPVIRDGIASTANALGISPVDLATAISYETGGTFDPRQPGPTTQWGRHRGLIQFGEPQAREHGVNWDDPVGSQLGPDGAVASYLRSTGVKPGMGLLDIYSAINAGGVGRYNRSDANNGGAPGTVRDKVEQQMAGHRAKALAMFAAAQPDGSPAQAMAQQAAQRAAMSGDAGNAGGAPVQVAQAQGTASDMPSAQSEQAQFAVPGQQQRPAPAPAQQPNDNARLRAALAVLNNPFSSPGAKALAQQALSMERKDPRDGVIKDLTIEEKRRALGRVDMETMTAPDGTVFEREKGQQGAQWKQTIQLPQKPEDRTSYQRELDDENKARAARGEPPMTIMQYRTQIGRANAPSVNIDQKQESAFAQETGKALAKRFEGMATEGDEAAQNLGLVSELRRLGQRIDFGAPAVAKSMLGRLGVKTDGISDIEAFNTLLNRLTPQQRLPGSGATSDFDAKMFKESLPTLMNTPEGNALVLDTIEKVSQNRMARGDIAMRSQLPKDDPAYLSQGDALKEIRKLQMEARTFSDSLRDFGKPKDGAPAGAAPRPGAPAPAADGWQDLGNGIRIRERK